MGRERHVYMYSPTMASFRFRLWRILPGAFRKPLTPVLRSYHNYALHGVASPGLRKGAECSGAADFEADINGPRAAVGIQMREDGFPSSNFRGCIRQRRVTILSTTIRTLFYHLEV